MTGQDALDLVLGKLEGVRQQGGYWMARCPAPGHDDQKASLSVARGTGQPVIFKCHAGCHRDDILDGLGLSLADVSRPREERGEWTPFGDAVAIYDYTDENGKLLFQVCRTADKQFPQRRPDPSSRSDWTWKLGRTRRVLYRLPAVIEAVKNGQTVYIAEGEKDVLAIEREGGVATCNPGGARKWRGQTYNQYLAGASVVIIADADEPGRLHAMDIAGSLADVADSVTVAEAAYGKDAADHLAAGHSLGDFVPVEPRSAVAARRLVLTPASSIKPEPVVWAWEDNGHGRIPAGSVSLFAGREGTGKSCFLIWLSAKITRGELPGSFHGQASSVIYVAVEDSWKYTIVPRLIASGADLDLVYRAEVVRAIDSETVTLSLPADGKLLEEAITGDRVALVVLDPLMSAISDALDTHVDRQVRQALDPLAQMADRTGAVVAGIAHFNKSGGTDASSLISGSGAFKDVPRSIFGFATDPEDGAHVITETKNNLGLTGLPSLAYRIIEATVPTAKGDAKVGRFVLDGESERTVEDILSDPGQRD